MCVGKGQVRIEDLGIPSKARWPTVQGARWMGRQIMNRIVRPVVLRFYVVYSAQADLNGLPGSLGQPCEIMESECRSGGGGPFRNSTIDKNLT